MAEQSQPLYAEYWCRICGLTVPCDSADMLRNDATCICSHCVKRLAGEQQHGPAFRVYQDVNEASEEAEKHAAGYVPTHTDAPSEWEQYGRTKRDLEPPSQDEMPE